MKAIRWHGRNDVRLDDIPEPPAPGPGQVKVRVLWCGICGTDLEESRHGPTAIPVTPHPLTGRMAPLVLGHEFCGEIVAVGPGATGFTVGDRVAVEGGIYCGQCYWCKRHQYNLCIHVTNLGLGADGGLAEFALAPAYTCVIMPPTLDSMFGALAEPLSVGVHAVRRSRIQVGETAAIFGAGPIGLLLLQVLRVSGIRRVFVLEPDPMRREFAKQYGATEVFDPRGPDVTRTLQQLTGGIGPDVTFECAGVAHSVEQSIASVRRGGRAVMVGACSQASFYVRAFIRSEKEIVASLSHICEGDYSTALELFADGSVRGAEMVTPIGIDSAISRGFLPSPSDPPALKLLVSPRNGFAAAS
jgi:(R,R)-butanediol dehydrogenase/meso-butanediol dehydrogenase/diacetyl reductase